ncbi:MAG: type I-C CRISPR-associated protein Cas8c/Csd1, partial [Oscillospiraceae bacterium]|nr:type I-C CRISPR-associated protein Cas8c/Csd1 [Oscillospiraceae bacterium]
MQKLYEVYTACEGEIGAEKLCPPYHLSKDADIEVQLYPDGRLAGIVAFVKPKDGEDNDAFTIYPVTPASYSRQGTTAVMTPHALCDNVKCLNEHYIANMSEWCSADTYVKERLSPILTYLTCGTLAADIEKYGVKSNEKSFVRFDILDIGKPKLYEDKRLRQSHIDHYLAQEQPADDYCYVTGEIAMPARSNQNPKVGGNGKLISASDSSNYTYRGRFTKPEQAFSVSGEVMEKAHNALRWLIARQGERQGDQTILAFGTGGMKTPLNDSFKHGTSFADDDDEDAPKIIDTEDEFASRFNKAISGYGHNLERSESVAIIGFDAATSGRLSIYYYTEMPWKELIANIKSWHFHTSWLHNYGNRPYFGAPSPADIIEVAYGEHADDNIKKSVTKRLLPCIANGASLPSDIMHSAVNRAVNTGGKDDWRVRKELAVACALI